MNLLFSEEPTNGGRQKEFDYAKLIAIAFMILIHMWEECTNIELSALPKGFFNNFLQFCAGPLAAPMFMTALGVGIPYSKHCTPSDLFKRGMNIFVLAYVLNILREALPYFIFSEINHNFDTDYFLLMLLNGDILQFAGLSFMLLALFIKLNLSPLVMTCIALFMQLLGFFLSINFPVDTNVAYLLGLFYKTTDMCFPFLQWFIYPCFGIFLATYLRHVINKDHFYKVILTVGASILTVYSISLYINGYKVVYVYSLARDVYYNQDFIKTLFIVLTIMVELSIIHFLFGRRDYPKIDSLAAFAGKHLNTIYIVQWLLIGWLSNILYCCFDLRLEPAMSLCIGVLFIVLSFIIVKGYIFIKNKG